MTHSLFRYISKALASDLHGQGVTIVNNVRKIMKAKALSLWDRAMLSRRFIIEPSMTS